MAAGGPDVGRVECGRIFADQILFHGMDDVTSCCHRRCYSCCLLLTGVSNGNGFPSPEISAASAARLLMSPCPPALPGL